MNSLGQQILDVLKKAPNGLKASEIALKLDLEAHLVKKVLYGALQSKVRQDNNYEWFLKDFASKESKRLSTPLAKICQYYLECISHDDLGGVSLKLEDFESQYKFVEIKTLPFFDANENLIESESVKRFFNSIKRDRNRQILQIGYPIRINSCNKTAFDTRFIEPIFLFPLIEDESEQKIFPANESPQLNFKALQSLTNSGPGLIDEAILLSDQLGLDNLKNMKIDLDELLSRLKNLKPEWDWVEDLEPELLSIKSPLNRIFKSGIYNRAVIFATETSNFTKGLESELNDLQYVATDEYNETALGNWLNNSINENIGKVKPILEVMPLNIEQKQAVEKAISNQLTVVTGPPGTGKSQVVTSILLNAVWQGKTVLFASRNNKAVDVVESRFNAMASKPILLRLKGKETKRELADFIVNMLAAKVTAEDKERFEESEKIHGRILEKLEALDQKISDYIKKRNDLDHLDQKIEEVRSKLGEERFKKAKNLKIEHLEKALKNLKNFIDEANIEKQSFIERIFWVFISQNRFSNLEYAAKIVQDFFEKAGIKIFDSPRNCLEIKVWWDYCLSIFEIVEALKQAQEYYRQLNCFLKCETLEDLFLLKRALQIQMAKNAKDLWEMWLQLKPSKLLPSERKILGDFSAVLQLIVKADEQKQFIDKSIFKSYYELFPQIITFFSSWAVTSLSVKGRIPLKPNFFDLLVMDEASQCDIASAIPLLYRAKNVVVIGDPKQLKHISKLGLLQDQQLMDKNEIIPERLGWSYSVTSLFELASSLCKNQDIVVLRDHHRSHAEIIEFSNIFFYENRLRVATNYSNLIMLPGVEHSVKWIDVKGTVTREKNIGVMNEIEAKAIRNEIIGIFKQGFKGSIGVVSPFRAQVNRIRQLLTFDPIISKEINKIDFLVDTIHRFQGDEKDLIIFSPVISDGDGEGALYFLKNNVNLFNVAITRARGTLLVVGNRSFALKSGISYLEKFAKYVENISAMKAEKNVNSEMSLEYPTVSQPELVSKWEIIFYKELYRSGIKVIPQYNLEKYILDFALIDGDRKLNIEIDGEYYHRNWDKELCRRDHIRNSRLGELGWEVMRFWVYQVRDEIDWCVEKIRKWIDFESSFSDSE